MTKETCISCGKDTIYDFETHIDHRVGYLVGVGQLCLNCFENQIDENVICISKTLIIDTPNDAELGKKVRYIINKK